MLTAKERKRLRTVVLQCVRVRAGITKLGCDCWIVCSKVYWILVKGCEYLHSRSPCSSYDPEENRQEFYPYIRYSVWRHNASPRTTCHNRRNMPSIMQMRRQATVLALQLLIQKRLHFRCWCTTKLILPLKLQCLYSKCKFESARNPNASSKQGLHFIVKRQPVYFYKAV